MTDAQNTAIIEAARQLLGQLSATRIPGVTDQVVDMHGVDLGERIGQVAGLALLVGGPAEGFNSFGILYGLGVAIGQWTSGEADFQRAAMLDEIKRGIDYGATRPLSPGTL